MGQFNSCNNKTKIQCQVHLFKEVSLTIKHFLNYHQTELTPL